MKSNFILGVFAYISFCSSSFAAPLTAAECRQYCEVGPTGWCIGLGTSAKQTAAPYIAILEAIQTGLDGKIEDTCKLNISIAGSNLKVDGSKCSIVQKSPFSNTEMKTEFTGSFTGTVSSPSAGIREVTFEQALPTFSWSTSQNNFFGPVPFVTSSVDSDGTPKVVWSNGEFCFSALVTYP